MKQRISDHKRNGKIKPGYSVHYAPTTNMMRGEDKLIKGCKSCKNTHKLSNAKAKKGFNYVISKKKR